MYLSEKERLKMIEKALFSNGLTFKNMSFLFNRKMFNSSILLNERKFGSLTNESVASCFIPTKENIAVENIVGLQY